MASIPGRKLVHRARSFFSYTCKVQSLSNVTSLSTATRKTSTPILGRRNSLFSRLPVELSGAESLMPLHSVTASALLKSLLSSKVGQWGSLSEGFATPL